MKVFVVDIHVEEAIGRYGLIYCRSMNIGAQKINGMNPGANPASFFHSKQRGVDPNRD